MPSSDYTQADIAREAARLLADLGARERVYAKALPADDLSGVLLASLVECVHDAKRLGQDPEAVAEKLRELIDDPEQLAHVATGAVHKAVKWDRDKHPRDKAGKFISRDAIAEAKTDPKKAAELRKDVKPEDAGKLEDALSGKTDLGRTAGHIKKEAVARRRADKAATKARSEELIARIVGGKLGNGVTKDDLHALADHLPNMNVEQLRRVRRELKASFRGDTKKLYMVERLNAFARGLPEPPRRKPLNRSDSVIAKIQAYGGIDPNSHELKKVYGSMARALEDGVPLAVFRKGGVGLDVLAQTLEEDGYIRVPEGTHAGEHVLDLIRQRAAIPGATEREEDPQEARWRADEEGEREAAASRGEWDWFNEPDVEHDHAADYAQNGTKAKAFRAWFGDYENDPENASKVVKPETGEPQETYTARTVFHGTTSDFNAFDSSKLGGSTRHPTTVFGHFFSESSHVARIYAGDVPEMRKPKSIHQFAREMHGASSFNAMPYGPERDAVGAAYDAQKPEEAWKPNPQGNGRILECYLNIRNPYTMSAAEFHQFTHYPKNDAHAQSMRDEAAALKGRLLAAGYDGIAIEPEERKPGAVASEHDARSWVAFEPHQIKATGNAGTFGPNDHDIHKSAASLFAALSARYRVHAKAAHFDPSRHPHGEHGHWSPVGSASAHAAGAPTVHADAADERARTLLGRLAEVPRALRERVSTFVTRKYRKLEARYGSAGAKAILGAMVALLPVPIPGSSLLPVAVAEVVVRLRRAVVGAMHKALAAADAHGVPAHVVDAEALLAELLAECDDEQAAPVPVDPPAAPVTKSVDAMSSLTGSDGGLLVPECAPAVRRRRRKRKRANAPTVLAKAVGAYAESLLASGSAQVRGGA